MMFKISILFSALLWLSLSAGLGESVRDAETNDASADVTVGRIVINGAIGPAVHSYIERAARVSKERGDEALIIQLDTPGGLLETTKQIVQTFYASEVPIVVWVGPDGANATSAGCFITLAADVAVMAPRTTIGSATPVTMGGGSPEGSFVVGLGGLVADVSDAAGSDRAAGLEPTEEDAGEEEAANGGDAANAEESEDGKEEDEGEAEEESAVREGEGERATDNRDAMRRKVENFAASFIQGIAEKRGRNVEWAIRSVTEGASLTGEEAMEKKVIDFLAGDLDEVLQVIHGFETEHGVLGTAEAGILDIPRTWGEAFFHAIWRPEVLFILTLVAIYGILGEISNPGALFPGMVGALALILVLYLSASLPVNAAAFALIALAIALFLLEVFTPTNGILSVGGVVSFVLGSLLLFEGQGPAFELSLFYILPAAIVTGLFMFFVVGYAVKAQRRPVATGRESMGGRFAEVLEGREGGGWVFFEGERWKAETTDGSALSPGGRVEVVSSENLVLTVKPSAKAAPAAGQPTEKPI